MRRQGGKRGFGIAGDQQAEIRDVARFPRRQIDGQVVGRSDRLARRRSVAAFQQRVCAGRIRKGEVGSAPMALSNASIAPGYMVSFAPQP